MNTSYEQSILFGRLWCKSKRISEKKTDVNAPHCINITPTAPCGAITIFSLTFFTCATDHAKKEGLLVVYNAYKCRDHHFFQRQTEKWDDHEECYLSFQAIWSGMSMGVRCCGNIARSIETQFHFHSFIPRIFQSAILPYKINTLSKKKKGLGGHR